MKITINREQLVKQLTASCSIISKSSIIPALAHNLFRVLDESTMEIVSSSGDQEISLISRLAIEKTDGKLTNFVCHGATILRTISILSSEFVVLEIKNQVVSFGTGKTKKKYQTPIDFGSDSFPLVKESIFNELEASIELTGDTFSQIIKSTTFLCAKDNMQQFKQGINIINHEGKTHFFTMNDSVSACAEFILDVDNKFPSQIIPSSIDKVSFLIEKSIKVSIYYSENFFKVTDGVYTIILRQIDAKTPDFLSVVKTAEKEKWFLVNRAEFMLALRRVSIYSNVITKSVTLTEEEDSITMVTEDKDYKKKASENIEMFENHNISGEISCSHEIMISILEKITSEYVKIYFSEESNLLCIRPQNDDTKHFFITKTRV